MYPATNHDDAIKGVTAHAAFRYRDRVDYRCADPAAEILHDIKRGIVRSNPPRWMFLSEPGDFYVQVGADERGSDRVYVIRDQLVITMLVRPDAETEQRQRKGARHRDRRRARVAKVGLDANSRN